MEAVMKRAAPLVPSRRGVSALASSNALRRVGLLLSSVALLSLLSAGRAAAQRGNQTLWGDIKIDDSKTATPAPLSVTLTLHDQTSRVVGRQTVSSRGRYRFTNLMSGEYELVVEDEDREIA